MSEDVGLIWVFDECNISICPKIELRGFVKLATTWFDTDGLILGDLKQRVYDRNRIDSVDELKAKNWRLSVELISDETRQLLIATFRNWMRQCVENSGAHVENWFPSFIFLLAIER